MACYRIGDYRIASLIAALRGRDKTADGRGKAGMADGRIDHQGEVQRVAARRRERNGNGGSLRRAPAYPS